MQLLRDNRAQPHSLIFPMIFRTSFTLDHTGFAPKIMILVE